MSGVYTVLPGMPHQEFTFEEVPNSKRGLGYATSHRVTAHKLILDVAKHLFARQGYEATSLAAIAHAAGVPIEEVTDHFNDKLGILMAVFEEGWSAINQRLQDIVINSINARQATLSMLAIMMRILEHDGDLARLLLFESRRPHPGTGEIAYSGGYRWFSRLCVELVMRGQKDGSFRSALHPGAVASMLTGAMESLMRDRYLAEEQGITTPFTGAQLMTAFDALVSYLGPEAAPAKR